MTTLAVSRKHRYLFTVDVRGEFFSKDTARKIITWTEAQASGYDLWDVLTALKLDRLDQIRYKHKEIIR